MTEPRIGQPVSILLTARKAIVAFAIVAFVFVAQGQSQSRTAAIPPNASASPYGGWTCDDGYVKRARSCVQVADATDAEVRRMMIANSLGAYPGNCPCPYNTDRAGRSCGRRSAYSRPGGASPLCYDSDITAASLKQFRARYPAKRGG